MASTSWILENRKMLLADVVWDASPCQILLNAVSPLLRYLIFFIFQHGGCHAPRRWSLMAILLLVFITDSMYNVHVCQIKPYLYCKLHFTHDRTSTHVTSQLSLAASMHLSHTTFHAPTQLWLCPTMSPSISHAHNDEVQMFGMFGLKMTSLAPKLWIFGVIWPLNG